MDVSLGSDLASGSATSPFRTLTKALDVAAGSSSVSEVRVAQGIYTPGTSASDSFDMVDGVALKGGYRSGTAFAERDPRTFITVLSGAIGTSSVTDNCRRVLRAENVTAQLSGFYVFAAYGSAKGGGIYVRDSSLTISKCVFTENHAIKGGGAYLEGDIDVWFNECEFVSNLADDDGGAISVLRYNGLSQVLVNRCKFRGNSAGSYGGALDLTVGDLTVYNSMFRDNEADRGGAAAIHGTGDLVLRSVTTSDNSANLGGSVYASLGSVRIENSILWGDSALSGGDELWATSSAARQVHYTCIEGGWSGLANFSIDPQFVDVDLHIRHPSAGYSPCVDSGDGSRLGGAHLQRDLDFNPRRRRPFLWLPTPAKVDRGAYEVGPIFVLWPGSLDPDFALWIRVDGLAAHFQGTDAVAVNEGDILELELGHPSGSLTMNIFLLGLNVYPTGQPPVGDLQLPGVHLNLSTASIDFVPVNTNIMVLPIPPGLTGLTVMCQGFAPDPQRPEGYVATDAREVIFQ